LNPTPLPAIFATGEIEMALPPNESIRNRQERAFQARVFAALERRPERPKSRIWMLLNSSFVLWLLSATLLSGWSLYLSQRFECLKTAETMISDFDTLMSEYRIRVEEISKLAAQVQTNDELIEKVQALRPESELGKLAWPNLIDRYLRLSESMELDDYSPLTIFLYSLSSPQEAWGDLSPAAFPKVKETIIHWKIDPPMGQFNKYLLRPTCGPKVVLGRFFGYKLKIAESY
jgi:hypothetical protein